VLREADYIFISELRAKGLYRTTQQAFAVLIARPKRGRNG
jgi:GMP synthase PP-ATPase subunit